MIEFFQRLFVGHTHKWARRETIMVQNSDGKSYQGKIVILECEICGRLKNHKIGW